jgi:hypothetical protein
MIMVDQSKRLRQPLRWTRAGRWGVIAVGIVVTMAVVLGAVLASTNSQRLARGCIEVTFASTVGAAAIHQCGSTARHTCAFPAENPGLAAGGALRDACRHARLPYGTG